MKVFEIPIQPERSQRMRININSIEYVLTMRWNRIANTWILDIADTLGNKILSGIPLVTGTDLLGQFGYLQIGGGDVQFIVITQAIGVAPDEVPTFKNLGTDGHLYMVT